MSEEEKNQDIDTVVNVTKLNQTSNNVLGITQEYNAKNRAKLWDDSKAKEAYKDKVFEGKKTYKDKITGETLHRDSQAAQRKYHMKNKDGNNISTKWARHSPETDHIKALKDAHETVKKNPFLTDADFKEIMNNEKNFRVTSKSYNTSKGASSDWDDVLRNKNLSGEAKIQIAKEKVNAELYLHNQFALRTAKNMGTEFASGAIGTVENSVIPLTAEAVRKMIKVAQGEEGFEDAVKELGKTSADIAVVGGTNQLLVDAVAMKMNTSNSAVLKKIANSNEVAQIIAVAVIVSESAVKYISGEINADEFMEQVEEKGTIMVAGLLASKAVGKLMGSIIGTTVLPGGGYNSWSKVGEVVATLITMVACSSIVSVVDTIKHLDDYKLKENEMKRIEQMALVEMKNQRMQFREIVEKECAIWDESIQKGFDQMIWYACKETYDVQGLTEGLDKVLSVFGVEARYKSINDYKAQLNKPLKLKF